MGLSEFAGSVRRKGGREKHPSLGGRMVERRGAPRGVGEGLGGGTFYIWFIVLERFGCEISTLRDYFIFHTFKFL